MPTTSSLLALTLTLMDTPPQLVPPYGLLAAELGRFARLLQSVSCMRNACLRPMRGKLGGKVGEERDCVSNYRAFPAPAVPASSQTIAG
jgi:hypothetical protein